MVFNRFSEYLKCQFPELDKDMKHYVESVIKNGINDFENSDEVYEAVGEVLCALSGKTQDDVRIICEEIMTIIQPESRKIENKILENPTQMQDLSINRNCDVSKTWINKKEENSLIDQEKFEKSEAKRLQKKEKRSATATKPKQAQKLETATASQIVNKKDAKSDQKGNLKTKDIRIESFDIAFGDKILIQNANLNLVFGRRYGLVGRNGLGKTTLLKMIVTKQLKIPSHITILHVEQEVIGDDTLAIDSVLECDTKRKQLLDEEKQISKLINDEENNNSALSARLSEIYLELEHIEADKAPARASIILNGLGFDKDRQLLATKTFSGGWRMRLALARALFSKPDLLLLDEPTNMLDMKAIIWLETYLCNWPTTLLVVSHDRNFLEIVPTDILHLHTQIIETYRGNYEQFEKTKNEKMKNQQREFEAQEQKRSHVQVFIDRFRYNANRASSVQSKIKMLQKLPELKATEKDFEVVIKFPEVESLSPPIIQIIDVSFKYGDRFIFKNVNLGADLDSRICIVGENGAGKTTLLKIIVQMLETTSGRISLHRNLKFGYFSQHHVDQLDLNLNSIELLQKGNPGKTVEEYRCQLGSFGISGDLALQSIESLSGGQKSRVTFANMCMKNPNFLVLDEPTNHLDIETIAALAKAIVKFNGGVIVVSHDERFIEIVCKELWVCGNQSVRCLPGGFKEYRALVEKEIADKI